MMHTMTATTKQLSMRPMNSRLKYWGLRMIGSVAAALTFLVGSRLVWAQDADPTAEVLRGVDTMWVLVAAFLVFFMQTGFALVEAGLTRAKNASNIMMKNLMDFVMGSLAYWAIGYGLMFGAVSSGLFGTSNFFLGATGDDIGNVPMLAFWLFQLVFAGTAATIVSGAMAERTKFSAYLIYSIVISAIIYPIFGHWVWGTGWLWTLGDTTGLVPGGGFRDFAGSTVVHSVGGWAALMGTLALGPRLGRFNRDGSPNAIPGHSVTLFGLGVFILWLGWFGFNPGSQLAIAGSNADAVALVAANTNLAAAAGAAAAVIYGYITSKKANVGAAFNGVLAGLVAITAPCAFVTPLDAIIIGAVGGVLVMVFGRVLETLKIDDPVGAIPVHLVCGAWGTLAIGLFASLGGVTGLFHGGGLGQLIIQLIGVIACGVWTAATAGVLFFAIKKTIGLRVSAEEEIQGLDAMEHGAIAYPQDVDFTPGAPSPATSIYRSGTAPATAGK
ncbi:MAG: ammonium transporter [Candidatus Roseilinea sp.]|nr:MAG: ammonium transporter [Candidatus Roseilinea sp.]